MDCQAERPLDCAVRILHIAASLGFSNSDLQEYRRRSLCGWDRFRDPLRHGLHDRHLPEIRSKCHGCHSRAPEYSGLRPAAGRSISVSSSAWSS